MCNLTPKMITKVFACNVVHHKGWEGRGSTDAASKLEGECGGLQVTISQVWVDIFSNWLWKI